MTTTQPTVSKLPPCDHDECSMVSCSKTQPTADLSETPRTESAVKNIEKAHTKVGDKVTTSFKAAFYALAYEAGQFEIEINRLKSKLTMANDAADKGARGRELGMAYEGAMEEINRLKREVEKIGGELLKEQLDARCFKSERDQLQSKHAELLKVAEAGWRLKFYAYPPWANAGGVNECKHGISEGIPCERCDTELLQSFAAIKEKEGV